MDLSFCRALCLGLVVVAAGCAGADDSESCPSNAGPDAPTIVEPAAGKIDVQPATFVISGSPFADADDGDDYGGAEVEIWRLKDGQRDARVWHAQVSGDSPRTVTLADGVFDDGPGTQLGEWTDYAVRMRYQDRHGSCSEYGAWSEDRAFRTDDGSSILFDPGVIRDFYLDIPPETWSLINAEAVPPGCVPFHRSYHTARLRFEGQTFEGVGIHIKGGCGSARDLSGKASFKLNLTWDDPAVAGCPEERRLLGQTHFTLNNGVQDHTSAHERVAYDYYKMLDVPTPRAATVRVFVNDEYWGVYTHVETIDRRFLSRWFDSNNGMLYEGTYWCDLIPQNVPPGVDDSYCLTREFAPDECSPQSPERDPMDYELLRQLTQQIQGLPQGGFYPEVEAFFDFNTFLSSWAVESVISHWDAYEFSIMNNYRVYHDPSTGLWTLIPTGIDQTFIDDQDPWDVHGVLAARCIAEPDCEAAFAARLALANNIFEQAGLGALAQGIVDQISADIQADPRKEYGFDTFMAEHAVFQDFIANRPARIRAYFAAHGL